MRSARAVMLPSSAVLAEDVLAEEVSADAALAGELLTEPPRGSSFQADIRLGITKTEVPRPSAPDEVFEMFAERQCLPRLTTIEDLAKPMLFLCSDEAEYMTGQIFEPDGGLSFN